MAKCANEFTWRATGKRANLEDILVKYPMDPVYVGCDPGVSGQIAILIGKHQPITAGIPVDVVESSGKTRKGKKRTVSEYDIETLAAMLKPLVGGEKWRVKWCIEASLTQIAGKANSRRSTFMVGVSSGMWHTLQVVLGFNAWFVRPHDWKPHFGLTGAEKDASRQLAARNWPRCSFGRAIDHNVAEALLLARYRRELDPP